MEITINGNVTINQGIQNVQNDQNNQDDRELQCNQGKQNNQDVRKILGCQDDHCNQGKQKDRESQCNQGSDAQVQPDVQPEVRQADRQEAQPEVQQAERQPIDRTGEVLISNETTFKELLGILKARPEVAVAALDEEKEKLRAEREKRLRKIYGEDFDKLISEEDKELLKKAKRRPGAVQLRTYEPRVAKIEIGADGTCEVYSNGYAVYDNGDRKTVIWVPGCGRAMYYFAELKESEKNCWTETDENGETHDVRMMGSAVIEDDVLWQLPWYHAVVIAGENQIELNLGRPKSKGTESDRDDEEKEKEKKEEWEKKTNYRWNCGAHIESPEEAYLKKEAAEERRNLLDGRLREVYMLYYEEGYNQREIAELLGLDRHTVDTYLRRARTKMEKEGKNFFSEV